MITLFTKTYIHSCDGINFFIKTPDKRRALPLIIIEHGSAGIASAEEFWIDVLNNAGYAILMIDHFSKLNIEGHQWLDIEETPTMKERSNDVLDVMTHIISNAYRYIDYDNIFMMGLSAGGTSAIELLSSDKCPTIKHTALLYPSVWPFLSNYDNIDGRNVTLFCGSLDNWCPIDKAEIFSDRTGAKLITVEAHHGFCKIDEDRTFNAISMRNVEFDVPVYHHDYHQSKEWYKPYMNEMEMGVTVKYNKQATDEVVLKWLLMIQSKIKGA